MLPKYSYFKIHYPAAHKYYSTLEYRRNTPPALMMLEDWAVNTRETIDYGRFINQFQPDIIKSIRQLERIDKKYVDKKYI